MRSFLKNVFLPTATVVSFKLPKGIYTRITFGCCTNFAPVNSTLLVAAIVDSLIEPTGVQNLGNVVLVGWKFLLDAAPVTRNINPVSDSIDFWYENKSDSLWLVLANTTGTSTYLSTLVNYLDLTYTEHMEGIFQRGR